MGACRHANTCNRMHILPPFSPTILLQNMYIAPTTRRELARPGRRTFPSEGGEEGPSERVGRVVEGAVFPEGDLEGPPSVDEVRAHFDDFYQEMVEEASKCGEVLELHTCANAMDHLRGNVYIMFATEDEADRALALFNRRFYAGRQLRAELSPVTDFSAARCKQLDNGTCRFGDQCNYHHPYKISPEAALAIHGNSSPLTWVDIPVREYHRDQYPPREQYPPPREQYPPQYPPPSSSSSSSYPPPPRQYP